MKKLLAIFALFLVSIAPAFAWHCVDTDQDQPDWNGTAYGVWGDNNDLGGMTSGWYDKGVTLPEGCTVTGWFQGKCSDVCVDYTLREFTCEDRPNYPGESVITWIDRENSPACGAEEVPEFGMVAAAGLVGVVGLFIWIKRRK